MFYFRWHKVFMKRQAGFTLLEILLVVVLMSLAALMIVQTLPQDTDDLAEEQASRFFQRLQLLSDDAILNGRDYGIYFDESKATLTYMQLVDEGWQPIEENKHFSKVEMEDGLTFSFEIGSDAWSDNDSLFEQEDFYDDRFEDSAENSAENSGTKKVDPPQVFVLSSSELTPFEIVFVTDKQQDLQDAWRVNVNDSGVIKLLAPGESNEE